MDQIGQLFAGQPMTGNIDTVNSTKRVDNNVPGNVCEPAAEYWRAIATRLQEIQVHNKAIRTCAIKFPGFGEDVAHAIGITACYLELHGLKARSKDLIIDFSGARSAWKRRIARAIDEAVNEGFLTQTGKSTIGISEKGKQLIQEYERTFEEARATYERQGKQRRESENSRSRRTRSAPAAIKPYIEEPED